MSLSQFKSAVLLDDFGDRRAPSTPVDVLGDTDVRGDAFGDVFGEIEVLGEQKFADLFYRACLILLAAASCAS